MLKSYIEKYHENNFQYILVDLKGKIIEVDNLIIPLKPNQYIEEVHPFFEVVKDLIKVQNKTYNFQCVYLNFKNKSIIADISVYTQNNNESLIVIEDLTKHYNNYQLTAQAKNESIINSQILELKNKYLIEKEKFKDTFIENFSHQLRNPITASSIFSDLLIKTELNPEQKSYANIILSANTDLKNRIGDILDISVLESGKLILHEKVFSLNLLLSELSSSFEHTCKKKNLAFQCDIGQKTPEFIEGDQYRLTQIIRNLVNNAITYTVNGSVKLQVSLNQIRAKKANLCFKVTDTGIGIDPKDIDAIFERFTKLKSSIQNDENIGLGLSITKYLVKEMGGNLKVESELNKGSVFTCNVSFKISNYNKNLKQELLTKQHLNLNQKKNILLVEDSELIQLSILKILASEGNFYVNIVSKSEDIIPTIMNQDIDLILLSNTIQGDTAEELTQSIRKISKEYKKKPIIIISSKAQKHDIKHFKIHGANNVIAKPFDHKTLTSCIYKYLK